MPGRGKAGSAALTRSEHLRTLLIREPRVTWRRLTALKIIHTYGPREPEIFWEIQSKCVVSARKVLVCGEGWPFPDERSSNARNRRAPRGPRPQRMLLTFTGQNWSFQRDFSETE